MNQFRIPVSMVVHSDVSVIQASLPEGYEVVTGSGGLYSISSLHFGVICALATVKDGRVSISFLEGGYAEYRAKELKAALAEKYPTEDPDRVVWQIFKPWHSGFTYCGPRWYESMDVALVNAFRFENPHGAFLCSFRAGDLLTGDTFQTLSSHRLAASGDMLHPGRNEGPMLINITNEE
ncbi:hypothetical protein A3K29_04910 [Candidatus Collierbacteria bacterium RIFOXYB2_FULL_46_14]|uniref:Uncharacterized protein n=1 Tax=Candidatus Collierbacteria bacterium GW2011_GWA2_46_26 TaxID=1618381 RepID=A0A0G1PJU0_9BACT|nr:MAG: hypothetical protein UX47_C0006G0055 [Candidatus Collierbacteria bacterium GW2011_GWA2_46_26]OGD73436.1 MAG: hypothetical protein A3K29_04910 [Candidatus Collierbacteria bacterium RIFOXYB2_FULL_46_14]OGD76478.1 MAG: hypothetical protein A3K43_04910 [Candidatus Collierbacteria bacterium RIFOXYA2_FULL_46_20]OGD77814.1 MAG: hypothetical protein A3K39_04910 [Candidatus Collierbacteria bacterium RIFOXYC2_FULL_43_15]OGD81104.1 MAG: hypothetical protein A2320_05405 [Pseudomonadales bacterium G